MKARVKATGDIIEISEDCSYLYAEYYDKSYNLNELEFLDVKENSFPKDDPDYWTRLEHQAAIAAMQMLIKEYREAQGKHGLNDKLVQETCAKESIEFAHALVEKQKKKEDK